MTETNQRKQAIVFAGGASHAAYHVGVVKALLGGESPGTGHQPLDPDVLTGISAGSFNAAVLLSQIEQGNRQPADYLEKVWLKRLAESKKRQGNGMFHFRGDPSELLNLALSGPWNPLKWAFENTASLTDDTHQPTRGCFSSSELFQRRFVEQVNLCSFVSMKPFKKSIRKSIDFEALRNSRRELRIGSVRWNEGTMRYFNQHELSDEVGPRIVRASAAVPGIFPRVKVNDEWLCDGAAMEHAPLSGAIDAGANELHVITSVPLIAGVATPKLPNSFATLYRFMIMRSTATLARDAKHAKAINAALRQIESLDEDSGKSVESPEVAPLIRAIGKFAERNENKKAPYKKIAIHVYHPPTSLGGILGLLNFDRKFLRKMIRKGYDDTVAHDCEKNGCDVP